MKVANFWELNEKKVKKNSSSQQLFGFGDDGESYLYLMAFELAVI